MLWRMTGLGLALIVAALPAAGQQSGAPDRNALLAGKLVYIKPIPSNPNERPYGTAARGKGSVLDNLDQWIIEDFRVWGRYGRTNNPEGVDLLVEVVVPEQSTDFETRGRPPLPPGRGGGGPVPRRRGRNADSGEQCPRLKPGESPVATINVLDWVTSERVWYAHLIDKKFKREVDAEIPAGPHTDVYVRGLTPDQTAMKLLTRLREYVAQLEKGSKPPAGGSRQ